jgi:hypothetical protein
MNNLLNYLKINNDDMQFVLNINDFHDKLNNDLMINKINYLNFSKNTKFINLNKNPIQTFCNN